MAVRYKAVEYVDDEGEEFTNFELEGMTDSLARYLRDIKSGRVDQPFTTTVVMREHAVLPGYQKPKLHAFNFTHASVKRFYRDWCDGKRTIPGLKVTIKDKKGRDHGPCKSGPKVIAKRFVSGKFTRLPNAIVGVD